MDEVKEVCFSGACNRGIAYVGVLAYLEEIGLIKQSTLKKAVGISIGSFILTCYLIGFSIKELLDLSMKSDISIFQDIEDIKNIDSNMALLKGQSFRKWVKETMDSKAAFNLTFKQFYEKTNIDFIVGATSLTRGLIFFDKNTPDVRIYDAIIASMCFPFMFPPYTFGGDTYIDGGVLDNIPTRLLGANSLYVTVSFSKSDKIDSMLSLFGKIIELLSNRLEDLNKDSIQRYSIEIFADDFDRINFNINNDDKITLYKRGYSATEKSKLVEDFLKNKFKKVEYLSDLIKKKNEKASK